MSAIDKNKLQPYDGILEVSDQGAGVYTRVASVRGLTGRIDAAANVVDIRADDTKTVLKGFKPEATIIGTFLENFDRDLIAKFVGGTSSDIAGAPISILTEALGTGWTVGQPIKLAKKMGDDTIVTSIVIDAGGSPLAAGTDYETYVGDGVNGELGFTYIVPVTAQAGVLDADYDYTPNAEEIVEIDVDWTELPRLDVRITMAHPTDETKKRIVELDDSVFSGQYDLNFADAFEAGDLTGTEFTFLANDGGKYRVRDQAMNVF